MICLAANGSPILKALLEQETLPLDYIKCPLSSNSRAEVEMFRSFRPVLLHGWGPNYWIGQKDVPEPDLLHELMRLSDSPYLSTHLDAVPGDFDGELTSACVLSRVQENVGTLHEIAGTDVLLENVPYFAAGRSPHFTTDPTFIAEALAVSGAGFLLDLAHARVSADHRGMDFSQYVNALPLTETAELHLSRPTYENGMMRDRHLSLAEADYTLLKNLLPRLPRLRTIALEYGGLTDDDGNGNRLQRNDPHALREQLFRLHGILKEYHAA